MKNHYFIFDLDGTLADTLSDIAASVNFMLEKMHMPQRPTEDIKQSIGSGIHKLVKDLTGIEQESVVEKAVSFFRETYDQHLLDNTRLYDGVSEFLSSSSFAGSVISNKPENSVKKILKGLGVLDYFDMCVGGLGPFPHKPDISSTVFIVEKYAQGRTPIFVGDSIIDQKTSRNANILFCFACYGYESHNEHLIHADYTIKQFHDLCKLFA